MNIQENPPRASRRSAITWMLTASSTIPFLNEDTPPEEFIADDPKLSIPRKNIWDRTLNKSQLLLVATLTDIIIPGDDEKPNSCDLHIPDFIDELRQSRRNETFSAWIQQQLASVRMATDSSDDGSTAAN